ncbi:MAG: glycosyltransferase family 39 protein, partial [Armatimonadetes bacterium]|nr:glycosyltransferase family 39 protein [Armatimonadota bacterium]
MADARDRRGQRRPKQPRMAPKEWPVTIHTLSGQAVLGALVAHLAFASALALIQPVEGASGVLARLSGLEKAFPPDESAHVAYFEELRSTRRLPVLKSGTGNYEAHQPPLYYLIATPVYSAFLGLGKREAVLAVRFLNVLLGGVSVLLIARLAIVAFPGNGYFVRLATMLGASWPARLLACSAANNDALVELTCLLALVWLARVATQPSSPKDALVAGMLVAVAMLSKSSALPLVPVGLLAVYWSWRRTVGVSRPGETAEEADRTSTQETVDLRALATVAAAFLAGFLLFWGPWAVRNTVIYGDPFAAAAFKRIFSVDRATPEYFLSRGLSGAQYYALVLYQTALSFWGVLGQANIYLPSILYAIGFIYWGLTALAGISGLVWRGDRPPAEVAPIWSILAVHGALMLAFFLRFNADFFQAQARYFMPATAVIAFYMARPWARRDWPRMMRQVAANAWLLGIGPFLG